MAGVPNLCRVTKHTTNSLARLRAARSGLKKSRPLFIKKLFYIMQFKSTVSSLAINDKKQICRSRMYYNSELTKLITHSLVNSFKNLQLGKLFFLIVLLTGAKPPAAEQLFTISYSKILNFSADVLKIVTILYKCTTTRCCPSMYALNQKVFALSTKNNISTNISLPINRR